MGTGGCAAEQGAAQQGAAAPTPLVPFLPTVLRASCQIHTCLAPTSATSPQQWVAQMGYNDLVTFTSTDQAGGTVYHTNVMMAIGTGARQQASWKDLM